MSLLSDETLWIFLLNYVGEASRHVCDVANGISSLEKQKIKQHNIKLVTDANKEILDEYMQKFTKQNYELNHPNNLEEIVKNTKCENIVVFVFGHGGLEDGIIGNPSMKPYKFLNILKGNAQTKNIIVYLSQCFAGVFNYVDLNTSPPNIVFIGATNLYPSISATTCESGWLANLFLLNLFEWIRNPIDIDGDGKCTVIDSYKYAGAKTNKYCIQCKSYNFEYIIELLKMKKASHEKIGKMILEHCDKKSINLELCNLDAIEAKLNECQTMHYNTQEPWILNANPAQKIEF